MTNHFAFKHGYFSKFRTDWSEMDKMIVNGLSSGKYMREIADSVGLKERYVQQVTAALRKARKVKNNIELIQIAVREGVINDR